MWQRLGAPRGNRGPQSELCGILPPGARRWVSGVGCMHLPPAVGRPTARVDALDVLRITSLLARAVIHWCYCMGCLGACASGWWGGGQALEFVGDALLDFLVTHHIYRQYPLQTPRQLTFRRASLVNNENMARIAVGVPLLLHRFLRHTSHTLMQHVLAFVKEQAKLKEAADGGSGTPEASEEAAYFGQGSIEAPKASTQALAPPPALLAATFSLSTSGGFMLLVHLAVGGKNPSKSLVASRKALLLLGIPPCCGQVLGDLLEAVSGAVFVDCGFDARVVWALLGAHFPITITAHTASERRHPFSLLTEHCQLHGLQLLKPKARTVVPEAPSRKRGVGGQREGSEEGDEDEGGRRVGLPTQGWAELTCPPATGGPESLSEEEAHSSSAEEAAHQRRSRRVVEVDFIVQLGERRVLVECAQGTDKGAARRIGAERALGKIREMQVRCIVRGVHSCLCWSLAFWSSKQHTASQSAPDRSFVLQQAWFH